MVGALLALSLLLLPALVLLNRPLPRLAALEVFSRRIRVRLQTESLGELALLLEALQLLGCDLGFLVVLNQVAAVGGGGLVLPSALLHLDRMKEGCRQPPFVSPVALLTVASPRMLPASHLPYAAAAP